MPALSAAVAGDQRLVLSLLTASFLITCDILQLNKNIKKNLLRPVLEVEFHGGSRDVGGFFKEKRFQKHFYKKTKKRDILQLLQKKGQKQLLRADSDAELQGDSRDVGGFFWIVLSRF